MRGGHIHMLGYSSAAVSSDPFTFRVGQKVVCVDDAPVPGSHLSPNLCGLKRGAIYTIRDFITHEISGDPRCLRLVEIKRRLCGSDSYEPPFGDWRFRPAVERKTDISIFTASVVVYVAAGPSSCEWLIPGTITND